MIDGVKYRNKYEANDMTEREELIYLKEENKKLRELLKKAKQHIINLVKENLKSSGQLKILRKYQVEKDIDGTYFLARGIYSMATFGKDFKKEAREFKKALENR